MARVKVKSSTDSELSAAEVRGREETQHDGAQEVHYDANRDAIVITLNDGNFVGLQRAQIPGLKNATPAQLAEVETLPDDDLDHVRDARCRLRGEGADPQGIGI